MKKLILIIVLFFGISCNKDRCFVCSFENKKLKVINSTNGNYETFYYHNNAITLDTIYAFDTIRKFKLLGYDSFTFYPTQTSYRSCGADRLNEVKSIYEAHGGECNYNR